MVMPEGSFHARRAGGIVFCIGTQEQWRQGSKQHCLGEKGQHGKKDDTRPLLSFSLPAIIDFETTKLFTAALKITLSSVGEHEDDDLVMPSCPGHHIAVGLNLSRARKDGGEIARLPIGQYFWIRGNLSHEAWPGQC